MMQIQLISLLAVLLVACAQNACGQDLPRGPLGAADDNGFGRRDQGNDSTSLPTDSSSPSSMIDDIPASAENETSDLPLEDKPSSAELDQQNQQSADLQTIDRNDDDNNNNNNNISNDTDSSNGRQREQDEQQSSDPQNTCPIRMMQQQIERLQQQLRETLQQIQQQFRGVFPQMNQLNMMPHHHHFGPPPMLMFGQQQMRGPFFQGTAMMPGQQQQQRPYGSAMSPNGQHHDD